MPDYMKIYDNFWKNLVETEGVIDKDKVARELHDYKFMIDNTTALMHDVSLGRISKPMTKAKAVMGVVEDSWLQKEITKDDISQTIQDNDTLEGLVADLKEYFELNI